MAHGKLIVLDGLDGCGKSTQFERLSERMTREGISTKAISFPNYDDPSAALVKMYLGGEFSQVPNGVNAYAASSFYAVDRYASYKRYWEQPYQQGMNILASRYVTSNAIHQMGKLPMEQWDDYLAWLASYEYEQLELPKPDAVIFLDLPPEVNRALLMQRYEGNAEKLDIHEADFAYLEQCRISAHYAAQKMGWHVVDCSDGMGSIRSIEAIHEDLWKITEKVLTEEC